MSDQPEGLPPLDRAGLDAARARAVTRGRRLRRWRRATLAGGAAAAALVVLGGVLTFADGPDRDVIRTVDDRTDRTNAPRPGDDRPTTSSPAADPAATTTTTESLPPDDGDGAVPDPSSDGPQPDCAVVMGGDGPVVDDWSRYWQTQPADNDPLTLELCVSDATPAPGEAVTVTVTADDPDSRVVSPAARGFCRDGYCEGRFDNGDGIVYGEPPPAYRPPPAPIPTPPEEPGHAEWYADYAYEQPGTYLVTVTWYSPYRDVVGEGSEVDLLPSPYRSVVTATLEVTVG